MTRRAAFGAAFLVSMGRPAWWLMALATFLLRGGIVLVLLPIVMLPSALAMSNAFAPIVVPLALGQFDATVVAGLGAIIAFLLLWLVGGGRIAAAIDVGFARQAAAAAVDEGIAGATLPPAEFRPASGVGWRVLALRLVAWLPLAAALAFGIARIVEATYAELTRPSDVATPLVARVAGRVVSQLGLIVVAWVAGEVVGGVATRRVALTSSSYGRSLAWSVRTSASRPLSWLVPWLATTVLLALVLAATLGASALAWTRAVDGLSTRPPDPGLSVVTLLLFVAVWLAALLLAGVLLAVRGVSQTFEHVRLAGVEARAGVPLDPRQSASGAGTFGVPGRGRPGDWSPNDDGGSL